MISFPALNRSLNEATADRNSPTGDDTTLDNPNLEGTLAAEGQPVESRAEANSVELDDVGEEEDEDEEIVE